MSKSVPRLFQQFQPAQYDLRLVPDRESMTFTGYVTARGKKAGRPSGRITFHQKDLKITAATLTKHDKKGDLDIPVTRINNQDSFHEVRLHADGMIYPGEYTVTMEFEGKISRGMTGVYPCFFEHDGGEKSLIATQFESHHAREAFPCIDEPEAKATFDLTLITPKGEAVLANTPVKTQQEEGDKQVTIFETTPRMSTYLLAFVFGDMHCKTTKTKRGTEVSTWATVAQPAEALDFALDVAKRCIEFFEDYFGVPYPLPKADHVALPDFSSGAMENWGLITYRERVLLAYPGEASQSVKETIATVVAHETSHQWFGNLVTMRWWDDLWLNESFANLMEYQAVNALFPEWQIWDSFINHEGLSALRRDSTFGVQAVKTAVHHPDEINTLFDPSIVYAKGGRLLYMLKNYIGEEAFRTGLSNYFSKHAYQNTEGKDLWAALSDASGLDVGAFMNPWLERSGFPVVTVTPTDTTVTLEQQHFLDNPDKIDPERLWPVPLFASSNELPKSFDSKTLSCPTLPDLLLINEGSKGHYIVNYANASHREALKPLVRDQKLSNADRLMLLNNASMLARAAFQSYGDVLRLLEAYEKENSEPVWDMMALIIGETRRFIDLDEALEDKIKALIRRLIAGEYQRLGWKEKDSEPASDQKLRATIIALGSYAEEPAILQKATALFEQYKTDTSAVTAELRSIVFGVPIKQHQPQALEYLLELHDKSANSDLKGDISAAVTLTRDADQAKQLLGRLKDPALIKPQDVERWIVYLLRNRFVRDIAWQWLVDNWGWLEETFKHDKSYDYLPRYAASICNTPEWEARYREFFEPKTDQIVLKRNIEVGLEEIATRVEWLNRDLPSVQQIFKNQ